MSGSRQKIVNGKAFDWPYTWRCLDCGYVGHSNFHDLSGPNIHGTQPGVSGFLLQRTKTHER
jgi:hypothetical protein